MAKVVKISPSTIFLDTIYEFAFDHPLTLTNLTSVTNEVIFKDECILI